MKRTFLAVVAIIAFATSAQATHFTILNGVCFNPAGNIIPLVAALANPHCGFNAYNPPNPDYPKTPKPGNTEGNTTTGKIVVGCIMGSALGLILASIHKGGGIRWMSQVEYEQSLLLKDTSRHLTQRQAIAIAATCGLAAFVYPNI